MGTQIFVWMDVEEKRLKGAWVDDVGVMVKWIHRNHCVHYGFVYERLAVAMEIAIPFDVSTVSVVEMARHPCVFCNLVVGTVTCLPYTVSPSLLYL